MKYMLSFQCGTHEEAQAVLAAVAAIGKEPMACSRQYVPKEELQTREMIDKVPGARKNISPGEPTITKIGEKAKEHILNSLRADEQPAIMYHDHLKLLWKRGEIKFDGEEYYL